MKCILITANGSLQAAQSGRLGRHADLAPVAEPVVPAAPPPPSPPPQQPAPPQWRQQQQHRRPAAQRAAFAGAPSPPPAAPAAAGVPSGPAAAPAGPPAAQPLAGLGPLQRQLRLAQPHLARVRQLPAGPGLAPPAPPLAQSAGAPDPAAEAAGARRGWGHPGVEGQERHPGGRPADAAGGRRVSGHEHVDQHAPVQEEELRREPQRAATTAQEGRRPGSGKENQWWVTFAFVSFD